jgi:hypothetical protein
MDKVASDPIIIMIRPPCTDNYRQGIPQAIALAVDLPPTYLTCNLNSDHIYVTAAL